ncbi:MAG: hypothetical protein JNN17_23440 [Verrucomicrobiaceae bacterium]|nr:hypothetical protein [Verrucomicrobiaceae bacterium]
MEQNPYAAPQSQILQSSTSDEAIRREHLNTEATIKSVGTLYSFGALLLPLVGVVAFVKGGDSKDAAQMAGGIFFVIVGIGQGFIAFGLCRLKGWVRIPTVILSCIGLLGFPVGTLINAYILVKVCGKQGKFVMTEEYHRIIAATPHIKRKTSIVVIILLVLLILILLGAIAAVGFG